VKNRERKKMTNYQPNFNDDRVQRRLKTALNFIDARFVRKTARLNLSQSTIHAQSAFGQAQNPLSKYLKQILLECTNPNYRFNSTRDFSKEYKLNLIGYEYLQEVLKGLRTPWREYRESRDPEIAAADFLFDRYQREIESGDFKMTPKSQREYHPLQFIPTQIRDLKFAKNGYIYAYDIRSAAITLLSQRAKKSGLKIPTPCIDQLIEDKWAIRNQLALECQTDTGTIKELLTALIQGAVISRYGQNRTFQTILRSDGDLVTRLQANEWINSYKNEVRAIWQVLKKEIEPRPQRVAGRHKAELYRSMENVVMKSVRQFLKKDIPRAKYMTEFDGWRTDTLIDRQSLGTYVRQKTGFEIEFEFKNLSHLT
jgi:hypothetical protein